MKYSNLEELKKDVYEVMNIFEIDRMPTSLEVRNSKLTGLENAIYKFGGYTELAKTMGLESKMKITKWNNEKISEEIKKIMSILNLKRMPNSGEILEIFGDNSLHCAITKHGGYEYWAKKLCLEQKDSETQTGKRFEKYAINLLRKRGYKAEEMKTKYAYDILVNDSIKVDVKAGRAYFSRGSRAHTFGINKKFATCDLYMIFALDEQNRVERMFIIPAHLIKLTSLNVGKDSIYNKYIDRWDYLEKYNKFNNSF